MEDRKSPLFIKDTTSTQIATHGIDLSGTANDTTYSYTYDDNGNILSISDGTCTTSYVYDTANQLVRENNQAGGFTHTWTYDDAGNILARTEYAYTTGTLGTATDTVSYTYGDTSWGDLLTGYDGSTITYDEIGNPLSVKDADGNTLRSYTWQHGRQMASLTEDGVTWNFTYNSDGVRIQRAKEDVLYTYVYNGSSLSRMVTVNRTDRTVNSLLFSYDASGTPLTVTHNGTLYYYVTNIQGDVIGITDSTGTQVVSYTYDAWGNLLSTDGTLASTLGTVNPLRYRGYVYDQETELYYLQSRYYDPEVGRFLNADGLISTGQGLLGNNMFAYCNNNSVLYADATGQICVLAAMTIGFVVGVASQFISGVVSNVMEGKTGADLLEGTGTVGEYVTAGLTGALCAIPGAPAVVPVVCDFAAPAIEQGIDYLVCGDEWSTGEYLQDMATNLVCDYATTKLAFESPEFIRDIVDEAHQLGIKGKKNLLKYLETAKDIAFYDGQLIGTAVSVSLNLGVDAYKAIKRAFM